MDIELAGCVLIDNSRGVGKDTVMYWGIARAMRNTELSV